MGLHCPYLSLQLEGWKIAQSAPTMFKFVIASCLATAALAQQNPAAKAKILKEQRFNAGDGRFGAAFASEDGTVYKEETGVDGERLGQYSYVGQDGKQVTVKYSAGKDGFKIVEGAHVPTGATGQNSAPYSAQSQAQSQRAQQPQQFAQQPQQFSQRPTSSADYDYEYFDGERTPTSNNFAPAQSHSSRPQQNFAPAQPARPANSNPFINPHDPTHSNFQHNLNAGNFGGNNNIQAHHRSQSVVPPCADCDKVNPFINPYDASHRNPQAYAPAPTQAPRQQFQQPQQNYNNYQPTQAPKNFFPPGKLNLNRFENGFQFDFASQ